MARDKFVGVRLSASGLDRIDQLAAQAGFSRSEQIRRMLGWAAANMPAPTGSVKH
jgi:hypothetical protein